MKYVSMILLQIQTIQRLSVYSTTKNNGYDTNSMKTSASGSKPETEMGKGICSITLKNILSPGQWPPSGLFESYDVNNVLER